MNILIWGVALLVMSFLLQIIIWRAKLPKRQSLAIIYIYLFSFVSILIINYFADSLGISNDLTINGLPDYLHFTLFFIISLAFYVIDYPGIEVDSPSFVIIAMISSKGDEGLTIEELTNILNDDVLVKPRLEDCLNDNMAYISNNKYKLTKKGHLMAKIFNIWRKLFNMQDTGG